VAPGLFYTGADRQLWMVGLSSMSQRIPKPAGGQLLGSPAAVWIPGDFPAFGRGTDNALWWLHSGSRWASLGGRVTSRPAAAAVTASGPTYGRSRYGRAGQTAPSGSGLTPHMAGALGSGSVARCLLALHRRQSMSAEPPSTSSLWGQTTRFG